MITEKAPGYYDVSGIMYQTETVGNKPFCHICRKRVPQVAVVISSSEGCNPRHLCKSCCMRLNAGFDSLPNS